MECFSLTEKLLFLMVLSLAHKVWKEYMRLGTSLLDFTDHCVREALLAKLFLNQVKKLQKDKNLGTQRCFG